MPAVDLSALTPAQRLARAIGPSPARSVLEASAWAKEMYGDRPHWSGVSLMEHVTDVVATLREFAPDEDTVVACILHHAMDVKGVTLDDVQERFGHTVRHLVSSINLLSHVANSGRRRMSIEHLRLMFLRLSDDPRGLMIGLCDRLAVLSKLSVLGALERKRLARDVLNLYAPVAARLGIYSIKHRLESLAFPVVYPTDAERIAEQLRQMHELHGHFLETASANLVKFLGENGVKARVEGREKQAYSIFMKMREKSLTQIGGLYDLFAIRVIVEDGASCYQVLGLLHQIGHPVPHRFKDFIAFPKPNGYQSLHTTLLRLPGMPGSIVTEVQVRTEAMHREAEYGVAAHWSYKEGGTPNEAARRAQMQSALATQQPVAADTRTETLTDHIFVLTPKGDVIELAEGATPLDFAFHVHTDLGIAFRGARVNGSIAPMDYRLENGDIVEILRQREPAPSPRWLTLLKTASARSRLKRYLASQHRPELLAAGRESLNRELQHRHLPLLDGEYGILRQVDGKEMSLTDREELLVKIGQGSMRAATLVDRLQIQTAVRAKTAVDLALMKDAELTVHAEIPMPVRFAKCCAPQQSPKGPIVGFAVQGRIRVHRKSCRFVAQANQEKKIAVWWEKTAPRKIRKSKAVKPAPVAARGRRR